MTYRESEYLRNWAFENILWYRWYVKGRTLKWKYLVRPLRTARNWGYGTLRYDIPALVYKAIRCIKCRTHYCSMLMKQDNRKYFLQRKEQELRNRGMA